MEGIHCEIPFTNTNKQKFLLEQFIKIKIPRQLNFIGMISK